jgi:hypothetical protein
MIEEVLPGLAILRGVFDGGVGEEQSLGVEPSGLIRGRVGDEVPVSIAVAAIEGPLMTLAIDELADLLTARADCSDGEESKPEALSESKCGARWGHVVLLAEEETMCGGPSYPGPLICTET